jgi:hypothetical protein
MSFFTVADDGGSKESFLKAKNAEKLQYLPPLKTKSQSVSDTSSFMFLPFNYLVNVFFSQIYTCI